MFKSALQEALFAGMKQQGQAFLIDLPLFDEIAKEYYPCGGNQKR